MNEGPARQNGAGNLLFVTRGVRDGTSQSARRYSAREQPLSLLGFGQFDRRAAMIRTCPDILRTSGCRAPGSQRHGQCKRVTSRTTAREDR